MTTAPRIHEKIALLFGSLLFLAGCTAGGPKFSGLTDIEVSKESSKSYIYIYRDNKFAGSAGIQPVSLDRNFCVKLKNGGYWRFEVEPGQHTIESLPVDFLDRRERPKISFSTSAGEVVFVKYSINMNSLFAVGAVISSSGTIGLALIRPSVAIEELAGTNAHNPNDYCNT